MSAAPRPLVLWRAGVAWAGLAGTDRHLVEALSKDVDVLWVDPPLSLAKALRRRDARSLRTHLEPVAPGVTVLRLVAPPFPFRPGVAVLTELITGRAIRRALRRLDRSVSLVVGTSPHPRLDTVAGARRVYYATDDFSAGASLMGKSEARFTRLEEARVREADVLGAVSPEIIERWNARGRPTFVLPNGCDIDRLAHVEDSPWPRDVTLVPPVAGMVGQLSPRVDLALLEAVADAGLSLLLVGPERAGLPRERLGRLLERPNVAWVGERPFTELGPYLRLIDVGLAPYVDDDFNRASFPLKILEYLAAGRPAVSTALPAVTRLDTPLVRGAADAEEFVAAVRSALDEGTGSEQVEVRRRFAAAHDWSHRADAFLAAVLPATSADAGPDRVEVVDSHRPA